MSKTNKDTELQVATGWAVDHDKTRCALCVVCARNCPTNALRREQGEIELRLFYRAELCNGCEGDPACQRRCPEEAIRIVEGQASLSDAGQEQLLNESLMVQCFYCREHFAPTRRLDVVAKRRVQGEVERELCPLCRRSHLVVQFIETHRRPGEKAEYRSAKDIIRNVKYRIDLEKAKKNR